MTDQAMSSIFCDDVRHEIGQKISLIGVYTGDLVVPKFPIILPKLCMWSVIETAPVHPFEKLIVKLIQENRPTPLIESGDLAPEARRWRNESPHGLEGAEALNYGIEFALSPFQIDAESSLRVVAETERGVLTGRRLRIVLRLANSESTPALSHP